MANRTINWTCPRLRRPPVYVAPVYVASPTGPADDGEVEDYRIAIATGRDASPTVMLSETGNAEVSIEQGDVVVRDGTLELSRVPSAELNRFRILGSIGRNTLRIDSFVSFASSIVEVNTGLGIDTLRLVGNSQIVDLVQLPDSKLQGFEVIDLTGSAASTLILNANEVINISSTTNTLQLHYDADAAVDYGGGWRSELPQIVEGRLTHVLRQNVATIHVVNSTPYQNPLRPRDTNRDGSVSPLDALIIINRLNTTGSQVLQAPTTAAGLDNFAYLDTNGDGTVAPIDVIQIINALNDLAFTAEGELAGDVSALNRNLSWQNLGTPYVSSRQSFVTNNRSTIDVGQRASADPDILPQAGAAVENTLYRNEHDDKNAAQRDYVTALDEILQDETMFLTDWFLVSTTSG